MSGTFAVAGVHTLFWPLNGRGGLVPFVATKGTKNAPSAEGFFAARAFAANQAKPGLQLFCRANLSLSTPTCKNLLCPATHRATLFCLVSGEADLLRAEII